MAEMKFGDVLRPTAEYIRERPGLADMRLVFLAGPTRDEDRFICIRIGSDYAYGYPGGAAYGNSRELEVDPEWPA